MSEPRWSIRLERDGLYVNVPVYVDAMTDPNVIRAAMEMAEDELARHRDHVNAVRTRMWLDPHTGGGPPDPPRPIDSHDIPGIG